VHKISDFGLAKKLDDEAGPTVSGAIMGTPSYMAPEQASRRIHDISPATDVYALGAILYELVTGRPPFKDTTMLATLEQVRNLEPVAPGQLLPSLAGDLETVCERTRRIDRGGGPDCSAVGGGHRQAVGAAVPSREPRLPFLAVFVPTVGPSSWGE
jgi:serine/threonine protein kinase